MISGWPHSFVAALESRATSWTALLDVPRLHPDEEATAGQLRGVIGRLLASGQQQGRRHTFEFPEVRPGLGPTPVAGPGSGRRLDVDRARCPGTASPGQRMPPDLATVRPNTAPEPGTGAGKLWVDLAEHDPPRDNADSLGPGPGTPPWQHQQTQTGRPLGKAQQKD